MGRKKFSEREINIIRKLLSSKMTAKRGQQKMIRHTLRTVFEFNISDFNIGSKPACRADAHNSLYTVEIIKFIGIYTD